MNLYLARFARGTEETEFAERRYTLFTAETQRSQRVRVLAQISRDGKSDQRAIPLRGRVSDPALCLSAARITRVKEQPGHSEGQRTSPEGMRFSLSAWRYCSQAVRRKGENGE